MSETPPTRGVPQRSGPTKLDRFGDHEPLVRAIARARASGEIREDVAPQLAAEFLLTTLNGLKVNARAGMPIGRLKEIANLALKAITRR
jgi:hypothetical protein